MPTILQLLNKKSIENKAMLRTRILFILTFSLALQACSFFFSSTHKLPHPSQTMQLLPKMNYPPVKVSITRKGKSASFLLAIENTAQTLAIAGLAANGTRLFFIEVSKDSLQYQAEPFFKAPLDPLLFSQDLALVLSTREQVLSLVASQHENLQLIHTTPNTYALLDLHGEQIAEIRSLPNNSFSIERKVEEVLTRYTFADTSLN